jgi:hypothetical protein
MERSGSLVRLSRLKPEGLVVLRWESRMERTRGRSPGFAKMWNVLNVAEGTILETELGLISPHN